MNQELIILSLLTVCIGIITTRQIFQVRHLGTAQIFVITHSVTLLCFLSVQWGLLKFDLSFFYYEKSLRSFFGLIFALYLAMVSLVVIQAKSAKKIKTLWRIPLLGLLVGTYFDLKYVLYIAMGNLFLLLLIPLKHRDQFRYLFLKIWPLSLCLPGLYFLRVDNFVYVNIFVLFCAVASSELIKIVNVNGMLRKFGM